jgi:molybdopterin synthase catalytic subunit
MEIEIEFTDQPIRAKKILPRRGVGTVLEFQGVVRDLEAGTKISSLVYEIYEPMAEKTVRRILEKLGGDHSCVCVRVVHRFGTVPAGEVSIHVRVESVHRAEGLWLMEKFMNLLKTDVPIWKAGGVPC